MLLFEWLFRKSDGTEENLLEILGENLERIKLAALAEEKAVNMIAQAVSRYEVIVASEDRGAADLLRWRLNVAPNDTQGGGQLWYEVARALLKEGKGMVVKIDDKFYQATSWNQGQYVTFPTYYTDIQITDGENTLALSSGRPAADCLVMRYENDSIRRYRAALLGSWEQLLQGVNRALQVGTTPLFKYKVGTNLAFRDAATGKTLTIEETIAKIRAQIAGKDLAVIRQTEGTDLIALDMPGTYKPSDLSSLTETVYKATALAYGIPSSVFLGTITEKSDADNEMVTYATAPLVKVIDDQLNARLVGYDGYRAGERIYMDLSRHGHVDAIDAMTYLDKARAIGFSLDDIRGMIGLHALNTPESQSRALTKNYETVGGAAESDGVQSEE